MTLTKIDDRGLKTPIDLLDNEKIRLGTGNDLEIYHNGSNSYIKEPNAVAGQFIIDGYNGTDIRQGATGEHMIRAIGGGSVELYYNGTKKLETTSYGGIFGNNTSSAVASPVRLSLGGTYHSSAGGDPKLSVWTNGTEHMGFGVSANQLDVILTHDDYDFVVYGGNSGTTERLRVYGDGTGVDIPADNAKLRLGTGQDFNIFHDGTDNIFQSGGLHNFIFKPKDTDVGLKVIGDGGVELYFDNSKKFEVTSTGVSITGNTLAVKPVKTIVNTNQDHTSGFRFIISLPNTSRMFKITGTFSFSGSGSGHIYADFGDWSDNHTANLEGASYQIREGGNSSLDDVGNSRYHKVTPSGFDCFNLEVQYEITLTTKAFANGNDTGTQEGGARPGAFGFIKYTHPSIGCALTTFTFQDIAASGTDRLNTFAWDIDGISGSVGSGEHTYVVEEYPLT